MSERKRVPAIELVTDQGGQTDEDLQVPFPPFAFLEATEVQGAMVSAGDWEEENLKPDTRYAALLVAIPEGYRLITAEELRDRGVEGTKYLSMSKYGGTTFSWKSPACAGSTHTREDIYIVPIKTTKTIVIDGKKVELSRESFAALKKSLQD
jgi:hypothetical protein